MLPRSFHYTGRLSRIECQKMPAHFGRDDRKRRKADPSASLGMTIFWLGAGYRAVHVGGGAVVEVFRASRGCPQDDNS